MITNIGSEPARFQVEIRYPGGPYSLKPRELAPGETATFDLRQIRDEQQPDRVGKTLPLDLKRGQFHWSLSASRGEPRLIGRAEVVSRRASVVSSYSCPTCCPDTGPYASFDPNAYTLYVNGFAQTNSRGEYYDCYGNLYSSGVWWNSMWTNTTSVATVSNSTEQLAGSGVGETEVVGQYDFVEWSTDGMDCYRYYWLNEQASAPVEVLPAPDRLKVVSDSGQVALAACPSIITRSVIYQVIDGNGEAVNRTLSAKETFANQTTNTCGNGQPVAPACGPTNFAGQIGDTLSITCGGQSGAQSNPSCGFTHSQTISTCLTSGSITLSVVSHSIKANQVKIDNTTQFTLNTILPK